MVISGADSTEFALKCATLFCRPQFAVRAALIFSDCAGSRHKENVEDAAVEEVRNRLAGGEGSVEGSGVQDRGKQAVDPDAMATAPAAPAGAGSGAAASGSGAAASGSGAAASGSGAAASGSGAAASGSGAAASGSGAASGAGLVPVNSNAVVALFTYRVTCVLRWVRLYGFKVNPADACTQHYMKDPGPSLPHQIHDLPNLLLRFGAVPKPAASPGLEGSATMGWKEFPEGDRATVAANLEDPGEFIGLKTFQVGAFQGGELDREELKEYNVRELNMPLPGTSLAASPNFTGTLRNNSSGPFFPTLGHRVEEFLRRFAPARLAREGRNGPLARAITSWASCMDLKDRTWAALALGPFAEGKIEPILRSRTEDTITLSSLAANFAYRPSSALLHCILSLFPPRSARFRSFLESLHVAPIPAVVPDSLLAPLLEGVMEELRLLFLFCGIKLLGEERKVTSILEPVVDSWRRATFMAWPAVEGLGEAGVADGEGDGLEECCAAMKRVQQEEKVMAEARRQAVSDSVIAADGATSGDAYEGGEGPEGGESGEGRRGMQGRGTWGRGPGG
ncbi:unnamed protein product [Closterium sp. Yama58-4]|nr:unnamed protein product [Closterium sp. Yama58-4]